MPELPDLTVYVECVERKAVGQTLTEIRLANPFLLRSVVPSVEDAHGRTLESVRLIGKRLIFSLNDDRHLVLHLMIAGRLRWRPAQAKIPGRMGIAAFDFGDAGTLLLTEASKKKRASLHYVHGTDELAPFDRGGISPVDTTLAEFTERLRTENRTLKRALTDPRIFAGIGNAYSDEILHRAQLAPTQRTKNLTDEEIQTLRAATIDIVREWTDRLRADVGDGFPEKVTAFRDEMAVHGKYRQPCPVCGTKVQRIKYASNESNYCPRCQTGGKLLADRAMSRLLKGDWPKSIEELEAKER